MRPAPIPARLPRRRATKVARCPRATSCKSRPRRRTPTQCDRGCTKHAKSPAALRQGRADARQCGGRRPRCDLRAAKPAKSPAARGRRCRSRRMAGRSCSQPEEGTLIRLARPANTVFVANPDIADVQVKSPELVYITAKSPGATVIYAVDSDDNVLLNAPVRVSISTCRSCANLCIRWCRDRRSRSSRSTRTWC